LEEPPAHVKFIFATTEIRKVPVTVLSRCQRFDLRRIEPEVMIALLKKIAAAEKAQIAEDALALITRAAEGSARDATSLLDQAISHGAGETTAAQVRAMLGLADRGRVLDLFDMILRGDAAAALAELSGQYADGADPMAVLRDLAEISHWISVIKITPEAADDPTTPPDERSRGLDMAARLPMRVLSRMWQMLLKALEEVTLAPNAMMAAEMAVIRLTHVADLPDPEALMRKLQGSPQPMPSGGGAPAGGGGGGAPSGGGGGGAHSPVTRLQGPAMAPARGPTMMGGASAAIALAEGGLQAFARFEQVVDLIRDKRDMKLLVEVETTLRLAKYSPGRIEFEPTDSAPRDLASRLAARLQGWTGERWAVTVVAQGGQATVAEQHETAQAQAREQVAKDPLVAAVLMAFPGARISAVRRPEAEAAIEALPEVEDEWDPFEEG
jgi:DNA polymerase-3 subunit gamma/tau